MFSITLLSIIIPARNEEQTIGSVLAEVYATLKKTRTPYEIIVVNDGSSDKTKSIAHQFDSVVYTNLGQHGKGMALRLGFKKAKGDILVMLDADYSHKAEDIPLLLAKLRDGHSLVIASRELGGSEEYGIIRGFGNRFLTLCFRMLFGTPVTDVLNGFKAFKKEVVKNYVYESRTFEIEIELVYNALKLGTIAEVPSYERKRAGGKMKSLGSREGWRFFKAILKYGLKHRLQS